MFNFLTIGIVGAVFVSGYALWRYFTRRPKKEQSDASDVIYSDNCGCSSRSSTVTDDITPSDLASSDSSYATVAYIDDEDRFVLKEMLLSDIASSDTTADTEDTSYTPSDLLLRTAFSSGSDTASDSSSSLDSFSGGDGGSFGGAGASDSIDSSSTDTSYSDSSSSYDSSSSSSSSDWSSSDTSSSSWDSSSSGFDSSSGNDWL